jgi:hypothetical protein
MYYLCIFKKDDTALLPDTEIKCRALHHYDKYSSENR